MDLKRKKVRRTDVEVEHLEEDSSSRWQNEAEGETDDCAGDLGGDFIDFVAPLDFRNYHHARNIPESRNETTKDRTPWGIPERVEKVPNNLNWMKMENQA